MKHDDKLPKKKRHIVEAAVDLFQRYGIKRVTVTEICETAHVSKMTFYKYFPNKVELAKFVLDTISERIISEVERLRTLDAPIADKARLWIESGVKLAEQLSPALMDEIYNTDEELADYIVERRRKNWQHFVDFLAEAQAKGDIRPDVSPEFVLLVVEKLNDLGSDKRALAIYPSYAELTRATRSVFFHGILGQDA